MAKMKNFVDATYDNQNVYLIINNQNEAIMIDASNATRRAIEYIKQKKLTLKVLLKSIIYYTWAYWPLWWPW